MIRTNHAAHFLTKTALINAVLLFATALLCVVYLAVNNRATAKGYQLRSLEGQLGTLQDEQKKRDQLTVSQQSMESVSVQAESLGFIPVSQLEYVTTGSGVVAVR